MRVYPELMEPLFNYAGHGSANTVNIPNLPQVLEVDHTGRMTSEPCINNPDYRTWWMSIIEDYAAATRSTASCGATSAAARSTT